MAKQKAKRQAKLKPARTVKDGHRSALSREYDLVVVAHPDDETIFFAGLMLAQHKRPWRVICVTDGNADGAGSDRALQFQKACRALGVEHAEIWQFRDIYEQRIDLEKLVAGLKALPHPSRIFTHGILGEYGHPHHQDVCVAVHRAFAGSNRVWSVAYNCHPDFMITLPSQHYKKKCEILSRTYQTETQKFSFLLPSTFAEGFVEVPLREVERVYEILTTPSHQIRPANLKIYRWFFQNLDRLGGQIIPRLF